MPHRGSRFILPDTRKRGNQRQMKVGRNDPCPCGSGKKYKKCCLEKSQAPLPAPPPTSHDAETTEHEGERDWGETESADDLEIEVPTDVASQPQRPPLRKYPRPDENLASLTPEEEKIIENWWKGVAPHYKKRDAEEMIQRVELALTEFPSLFIHLGLHEEFLFELGGELGRRGRIPDYIALLKRLRRDQRQMYSFSYGAYDSGVIAELVVAGQAEEIPAYLDLFKQYPDAQPDYCHQICNLLAWRGLTEPLYLLCESVATPMVTSSEVVGGHFALDWLIRREEVPFYKAGDASAEAVQVATVAIKTLGERLQFPLTPDEDWLSTALRTCLESPQVETHGYLSDLARQRLGLNFVSHLHRTHKVPWVQGFLLGDLLQDYVSWSRRQKLPWFRLHKKDIEAFAVYRSKQFFCVDGVILLGILQGMTWFADYLQTAAVLSVTETARIRTDCRQLFDAGRKAVDSTDAAYRICPTFEQLALTDPG